MRFTAVCTTLIACFAGLAAATANVHTLPYKRELRVHPFSTLPQAPFAWLDGATVSIEFGYAPGYDKLLFDYSGQFNISAEFNAVNGVLYLRGSATASEYTNAISSVVFFTTATDGDRRQLTYSFGSDTFYFSLTGHYYRYNNVAGLRWIDAAERCAASSYFGIDGYLATVNSEDEQNELSYVATFDAWLGGNDRLAFGEYRWVTGPGGNTSTNEGPLFWTGQSQYVDGVAPENVFAAWNRFQPDNAQGSGNDYLYLVNSADQDTSYWAVAGDGDLIGGYICEYGSPSDAMTGSNMGGSIELIPMCNMHQTKPECLAETSTGCTWEQSTGQCVQSTCAKYTGQVNCEADATCEWNVEGNIGVCVNTACGSLAGDVCQTNPQCTIDNGVLCRNAVCSDRETPCSCNTQSGCSWRNGVCGSVETLDCNADDVVFVLDGSALMMDTFGRYPNAFYGLTDTIMDTEFLFNGNKAGTKYTSEFFGQRVGVIAFGATNLLPGGTGRLTSDRSEFLADLTYLQQQFAPVGAGRNIRTALEAAANMFDGAPNRTRTVVIVSAGKIGDAAAIRASYAQGAVTGNVLRLLRTLGIKTVGVALSASSSRTEESVAAMTSLENLVDENHPEALVASTIRLMPQLALYGLCDGTSLSTYVHGGEKPSIRCGALTDQVKCGEHSMCAWNAASQICDNNLCISSCSQDACDENDACQWVASDQVCVGGCALYHSDTECDANSACMWDIRLGTIGMCVDQPCINNPTEDACIADTTGCMWNPGNATPCSVQPCSNDDPTACAAEEGCVFTGTVCALDLCRLQEDGAACSSLPQCEWKAATSTCQRNACGMKMTETDCASTDACLWNISRSPAACGPAPCTSLNGNPNTAQILCGRDDRCMWSTASAQPRCIQKQCEFMTSSCDCNAMKDCLWRNNSCKENPFVQCPGADVVFAIEATPVMLEAFGRHPNGLVGVIEAIRGWSADAPFSVTPDATGFRFSMMLYGQPNRAFFAPSDVGGGGNLTSSREQWLGPNQEINWLVKNYKTNYAKKGQTGSVALRPALTQAISVFNNAQGTQRKRMLVIVGNSAITDGGSKMLKDIDTLEAMGVRIFGNIARRFSYITPVDTRAAEFMRPIASDPPAVFFSFTTIDTMRDTLLENFCDPSSPTGKVLQISRNGELPCSWLEGEEECNLQGSCRWDGQATKTCPLASQCPTLNCQVLPANLANLFDCEHCTMQSGAISCSRANPPPVQRGLCKKSTCATTCQGSCTGGCEWVAANRCERDFCGAHNSSMMDCIANPGCVYKQKDGVTPYCAKSICGRYRDVNTCGTFAVEVEGAGYEPCFLNKTTTPMICQQKVCGELNDATCQSAPMSGDNGAAGPCTYAASLRPRCRQKVCQYNSAELCEFDAGCYWNAFTERCNARISQCVLSPYSDWAPCSATCGAAITYKSRAIVQYPSGGASCAAVASTGCWRDYPHLCTRNETSMTVVQSCTVPPTATDGVWVPPFPTLPEGEWPMSCASHCTAKPSRQACIMDSACRWKGSSCEVKPFLGCPALSRTECDASDMCAYDNVYGICQASMDVCPYHTQNQCNNVPPCTWRTGSSSLSLASSMNIPLQLFNPGQQEIYPFDTLESNSQTYIFGATVTIEGNYQRGKDVLQSTHTQQVRGSWIESAGTLMLTGRATVSEYMKTIRFVTFTTTSTRTVPRTITWSLGNETAYSSKTKHHYRVFENARVTYGEAAAFCANTRLYGLVGYLATITSDPENDLVSTKLFADGWIGGQVNPNMAGNQWAFTTGPESGNVFWSGPAASLGGQAQLGAFTNWAQPNNTNLYGEPILTTGSSASTADDSVYMSRSGFWESRPSESTNINGYICEYGGLTDVDQPASFQIGGAMMVGIGGCVAQTCVWHKTQADCELDVECGWHNGVCEPGCGARSTEAECRQSTRCRWDASVLPPVCDFNPCSGLAQATCPADARCEWSSTTAACKLRQGCAAFPETDCNRYDTCHWTGSNCLERGCSTFDTISECRAIPRCRWDTEETSCVDQYCMYPTEQLCATDSTRCVWNVPADSNSLSFSPNRGYIYPFKSTSPMRDSRSRGDGFTVAITAGFQPNMDKLSLALPEDDLPNYQWTYDGTKGVLRCFVAPGVNIVAADVWKAMSSALRFSTTSGSLDPRRITYTMSANAVYSAQTGNYYKWFPTAAPTTLEQAMSFCAANPLYDMPGTLARIMDETDQQRLRQAGASGWLAGSSNAEGLFTWSMPSGLNVNFWNGTGMRGSPIAVATTANGTMYRFAQWDLNQPSIGNSFVFLESSGFWKSSASMASKPGVVCQYLASQTEFDIGLTKIAEPSGCFVGMCKSLTMNQCGATAGCLWQSGLCARDTRCTPGRSISTCAKLADCYWDYDVNLCVASPPSACAEFSTRASCQEDNACMWNSNLLNVGEGTSGACVPVGCQAHLAESPCLADPRCKWENSVCLSRLCGYTTSRQCWAQSSCVWDALTMSCSPSQCVRAADSTSCDSIDSCTWSSSNSQCEYVRCSTTQGVDACLQDKGCLFKGGRCMMPACHANLTQAACSARPECFYFIDREQPGRKYCGAAWCTSYSDASQCTGGSINPQCKWQGGSCRNLAAGEAETKQDNCEEQVNPNMWWLWLFLAVILILLGMILHRLYLAHAGNMNFFEPTRKNYKYNPHERYAAAIVDDAKQRDEDANVML